MNRTLPSIVVGVMLLFVPALGNAETIVLMCTVDTSRTSLPEGASVNFQVDLDRGTIGYVDEDGSVAWRMSATVSAGSIVWNGYTTKWFPSGPGNWDPAYGSPSVIRDLAGGSMDPGPSLQGRINRTSGDFYGSALYFPSPGRYKVIYPFSGRCRLATQKF